MTHKLRKGETFFLSIIKRSERIVLEDDYYFYRTREYDLVGPFFTESKALFDLNLFLEVAKIEQELQVDQPLLAL